MGNNRREHPIRSTVEWEHLDEWVRGHVRDFIQRALEDEVTEFLGRGKSVRRTPIEEAKWYRNGYGNPRRLTTSCGTVQVKWPRLRNCEDRFESRVLPLFKRKSKAVGDLLPELYLHGLAQGDFDLALRSLLGDEAPLSASTVARLKDKWHAELEQWQSRNMEDVEAAYLWVDGIYVKAGFEKEKSVLLVVLAALSDGSKVFLSVTDGQRESTRTWSAALRDLRDRGLTCPRLIVGDGHLGIWGALHNVFPAAEEQRCWNHKLMNVVDKLPRTKQAVAKQMVTAIPKQDTRKQAETRRDEFVGWCMKNGYPRAADCLMDDWERMMTFYRFPKEHWQHLRTSNPVESPFAAARLRTKCCTTLQEGRERHCHHLENPACCGEIISPSQASRTVATDLCGNTV